MIDIKKDDKAVRNLREQIVTASHFGGDGNLQSVFSSLDLMYILYEYILNARPSNAKDIDRDYFVLSKGQATLGLYCILARHGYFDIEEVNTFCKLTSRFGMQADRTKFNGGIEVSAGSLGHGFPQAVGAAIAGKVQKSPSKIFSLAGDGEFNEGTMWEAALMAGAYNLDNLCVVIDDNDSIGVMVNMGDMEKKLQSFGFDTLKINGHSHKEIYEAYSMEHKNKPMAIIAKTKRGYGSETMMKYNHWFHRSPSKDELELLIKEIKEFETCNV